MDITKMSVTELKAMAYDALVQMQYLQSSVATLNAEIEKKMKGASAEVAGVAEVAETVKAEAVE